MRRPLTITLLAAAVLAGCASPGTRPPAARPLQATALGARADAAVEWPQAQWWRVYGDARLDALVERALAGSPGLAAAEARVRQARAALGGAQAATRPQLNASVQLTKQRFTENGLVPPPLAGTSEWNNEATLSLGWSPDLFGRQRAALDAAIGSVRAAQAEQQAARVLLAGQLGAAYVGLAHLVEARSLAQQALAQREQVLVLVRERIAAGLDNSVDLRQAEGLVAQSQVEREALDEAIVRARHALAELSGQGPEALADLAPALAPLRSVALPAALPADLIGRRADLVAQRWRVEAATHEVDAAKAAFYPDLNLVAFVGLSSLGLDRFLELGSRSSGVGPALHLPIFDGGRLRASLGARGAEADAAVAAYDATLLRALREVADELSTLQSLERQQAGQQRASEAAEAAFELAVQRYRAGLGNFLVVLTAQNTVIAQRRAATELKARHLGAEIALARALGGGYDDTKNTP